MKTAMKRKQSRPRRKECKECAILRGRVEYWQEQAAFRLRWRDIACNRSAMLDALSHALERANSDLGRYEAAAEICERTIHCLSNSAEKFRTERNQMCSKYLREEDAREQADAALASYVSDFQSKKAALDRLLMLLTMRVFLYHPVSVSTDKPKHASFAPKDWIEIAACMNELAPKGVRTT